MRKTSYKTIDDYLAPLPAKQRAALNSLRKAIKATVPRAEECISYQIPGFRLDGKYLLGFGAAIHHVAFYPGAAALVAHASELK